jgi:hypothetical protein
MHYTLSPGKRLIYRFATPAEARSRAAETLLSTGPPTAPNGAAAEDGAAAAGGGGEASAKRAREAGAPA